MASDIELVAIRFGRDRGKMPPAGPLHLAGSLDANGISWQLTDTQFRKDINPFSVSELGDLLLSSNAKSIGLSLFNDALPLVVAVMDAYANQLAHKRIFLGGPGVVGTAKELLQRLPCVEAVVVGEGESVLPILVRRPQEAAMLPGVFTRHPNGTINGSGATAREDLNSIAPVPWHWAKTGRYTSIPLSTMRGCPFTCSFCEIIAFLGRRVTKRNLDLVFDDLEQAMEVMDTNHVEILDDTFTVSKSRVLAFCKEIARRGLDIRFSAFSRTDTIDTEMMQSLASAGCHRVFFGLDAGDDDVLTDIAKGVTAAEAEATIKEAAKYFSVTASMIWGFPFESWRAFNKSLEIIRRLLYYDGRFPIWPQMQILSPSAGTPLYERFGQTVVLDTSIEGLMCGNLGVNAFRPEYNAVFKIIREEPLLAAPFYRYETPEFGQKREVVEHFNGELDARIGRTICELLTLTKS